MRALVAPDKFKGSLPATDVADAIADGLAATGVDAVTMPLADGGDGSVAAAVAAGMRPHACAVTDALGRPHIATIAVDAGTAVVEVACWRRELPRPHVGHDRTPETRRQAQQRERDSSASRHTCARACVP
ncbi:hypothetical protein A4G26_02185 [Mycobacterium kansasii]|uniref:Glycerate 2-kinase n=1 Tax=Mycobacterium innocens TaxID=2341083 RepID=A0A498QC14_9MYCO|nr:glycerate kinase [Mycobacterium kansasii]KZS57952.1 hypothetical protein A4G26_02185 [Mycobacterium kansasii]VBA43868.1 Glycerate 2-kinase [Mycobacterium innocens]